MKRISRSIACGTNQEAQEETLCPTLPAGVKEEDVEEETPSPTLPTRGREEVTEATAGWREMLNHPLRGFGGGAAPVLPASATGTHGLIGKLIASSSGIKLPASGVPQPVE